MSQHEEIIAKRLRKAKKLYATKDYENSAKELAKLLEQDPENVEAQDLFRRAQKKLRTAAPADADIDAFDDAFGDTFMGEMPDISASGVIDLTGGATHMGDDFDFSLGDDDGGAASAPPTKAASKAASSKSTDMADLLGGDDDEEWDDFREVTGEFKVQDFIDAGYGDPTAPAAGGDDEDLNFDTFGFDGEEDEEAITDNRNATIAASADEFADLLDEAEGGPVGDAGIFDDDDEFANLFGDDDQATPAAFDPDADDAGPVFQEDDDESLGATLSASDDDGFDFSLLADDESAGAGQSDSDDSINYDALELEDDHHSGGDQDFDEVAQATGQMESMDFGDDDLGEDVSLGYLLGGQEGDAGKGKGSAIPKSAPIGNNFGFDEEHLDDEVSLGYILGGGGDEAEASSFTSGGDDDDFSGFDAFAEADSTPPAGAGKSGKKGKAAKAGKSSNDLESTMMRDFASERDDDIDFSSEGAIGGYMPSDESLGFSEGFSDETAGDSLGVGDGMDEFNFSDFSDDGETMGIDSPVATDADDSLEDTFGEDLPEGFTDDYDIDEDHSDDSQVSEGFYSDFGSLDETHFQLDDDTSDSVHGDADIEKIKRLWTEGSERFRQKDYAGCIRLMKELLAVDPANESAQSYIEMAQEKLEGDDSPSHHGLTDDSMHDDDFDSQFGSIDLSEELTGDGLEGLGDDDFLLNDTLSPTNSRLSSELGDIFADDMDTEPDFGGRGSGLEETLIKPAGAVGSAHDLLGDLRGKRDDIFSIEDSISRSFVREPLLTVDEDIQVPTVEDLGDVVASRKKRNLMPVLIAACVAIVLGGGGFLAYQFAPSLMSLTKGGPAPVPTVTANNVLEGGLKDTFQAAIDLYNGNRFEEALTQFNLINEKQPGVPDVLERIELCKQRIEEARTNQDYQARMERISSLYAQGEDAYNKALYGDALTFMNQVLELQPENQGAQYFVRKAQEELDKQRAEQKRQDSITARIAEADAAFQSEDFDRAVALIDQALEMSPDNEAARKLRERSTDRLAERRLNRLNQLINEGKEHYDFERYKSCIRTMQEALSLNPDNLTAKTFIELSERALTIQTLLAEAQAAFDAGKYEDAISLTEKVMQTEPNNETAKQLKKWSETALADYRRRVGSN